MESRPLPAHLMYEFLSPNHTFLVIITAKLNGVLIEKLFSVLQKHRGVISYSIDNIKEISPLFCMHRILLDDGHRPSRQPQRLLNPNSQEAIKKEAVKLLDARIICPISDSDWVSSV